VSRDKDNVPGVPTGPDGPVDTAANALLHGGPLAGRELVLPQDADLWMEGHHYVPTDTWHQSVAGRLRIYAYAADGAADHHDD
jgi:hypothetical protein